MTGREIRAELTKAGKKVTLAKFGLALEDLGMGGKTTFNDSDRENILRHFGVIPTGFQQDSSVPFQSTEETEVSALTVMSQSVNGLTQVHNMLDAIAHQHAQQMAQRVKGLPTEVMIRAALLLQEDQTQQVDVIGTLYAALAPGKPTYALKPNDTNLFLECM